MSVWRLWKVSADGPTHPGKEEEDGGAGITALQPGNREVLVVLGSVVWGSAVQGDVGRGLRGVQLYPLRAG